ncbi:putative MFS-type transporter [Cyphellophora attinorum]|uniref:Putative MFS-type transporter n=1 Tax=Cyphellophora attinorum TaxID=1664694 RepID=A0A0N0NQM9_9EURO|nr:putative MFS-type transporter [Phialophora attinorum]KPI43889.1 putative MFS-type transporter [Phialophora attinorum]
MTTADGSDTVERQSYWNHAKTFMLILAVNSSYFAQLTILVGAGAFARTIASVVGGESLVAWPASVIVIFIAALSPLVAQAADYWGRKWFIVILAAIGCVGCIVVARGTSMNMVIAGFCLGGVSSASSCLIHTVASEVLPRRYRSWAQATVNGSVGLGSIFGLCVGGALTRYDPNGFRTYFAICAGVYAFSALACAILYNAPPRQLQLEYTFGQKLRTLDWPAYVLITGGLVLFCLGLSWSQNPYSWTDAHVLAPFLIGCSLILGLLVYSWKMRSDGLLHHDLFHDRNFAIALGCIFIEGLSFLAANIFVPYSLSIYFANTMNPFQQALCYNLVFCTFLVSAFGAGYYVYRSKSVRVPAMIGFLSFLIFFILMATVNESTSQAKFWGYMVFCGLGLGFCITTLVTAAQFATPPELIAVTSGLMLSMRSVGASAGAAVMNAIFANGLSQCLLPRVAAAVVPLGLQQDLVGPLLVALTAGDLSKAAALPGVTNEIISAAATAMKQSYGIGFRYVFVCAAAFSAVALIASIFLRNPRAEFTPTIDAPIDGDPYVTKGEDERAMESCHEFVEIETSGKA